MFALDYCSTWLGGLVAQRDRLEKLDVRYDPCDISHVYFRDPETREFRAVERREGMLIPMTLWEHQADRLHRRRANVRADLEKVSLHRQIADIAGRPKSSKAELCIVVRRTHAAEAANPYDAMRPRKPAPNEHPVHQKHRLPCQ